MIFGLYLHWPFCLFKCPYCDFNSHVRSHVDHGRFREALRTEMRWMAENMRSLSRESPQLASIFFGGGTPSLMDPQTVRILLQEAQDLWPMDDNVEVTLEANPTSVEAEKFIQFREAGINRLSLGIQSLRADQLRFLGRQHTTDQSHQALELAASLFPRFSFDLIYALPHQTPEEWQEELGEALRRYNPSHLSLYQLTYEPGTPFYTRFERGDLKEPEEAIAIRLFEITQALTRNHGLEAYEISNYAKPGEESRHNLGYWRGNAYIGVGPGAHGRFSSPTQVWALQTHKLPEKWLTQVETIGHGLSENIPLTPEQRFLELLSMGLRLKEGLSSGRIEQETGMPLEAWIKPTALNQLTQEGLINQTPEKIYLTAAGRLRLNAILAYCLP